MNPSDVDEKEKVCHNETGAVVPCPPLTQLYADPHFINGQLELT